MYISIYSLLQIIYSGRTFLLRSILFQHFSVEMYKRVSITLDTKKLIDKVNATLKSVVRMWTRIFIYNVLGKRSL